MGWHHCSILVWLAFLAAAPREAAAYPTPVDFDGTLLRWQVSDTDPPIAYEIKADREADKTRFESLVEEAAQMWNDVPTSYFAYAPVADGQAAQVTVELKRSLDGSAYSAGYAIFDDFADETPKHCSIFVFIEDRLSEESVAKTLLHELGHCIGLGHTLIPEAIMSYALDKNSFSLDIDDQAAVTRLYPADGSKPKLPSGCAIATADSGRKTYGFASLALLFLAPMFGALSRVRRGRDQLDSVAAPTHRAGASRWRASGRSSVWP